MLSEASLSSESRPALVLSSRGLGERLWVLHWRQGALLQTSRKRLSLGLGPSLPPPAALSRSLEQRLPCRVRLPHTLPWLGLHAPLQAAKT